MSKNSVSIVTNSRPAYIAKIFEDDNYEEGYSLHLEPVVAWRVEYQEDSYCGSFMCAEPITTELQDSTPVIYYSDTEEWNASEGAGKGLRDLCEYLKTHKC